jgi:site-specific recombinase XerD
VTAVDLPLATRLADLADAAAGYAEASKAPATLRGYRSDWRGFTSWCDAHDLAALPAAPATVVLYLTELAGVKAVATMQRHLTAIAQAHAAAGHASPTRDDAVRTVWSGIRRTFGTAPRRKAPLLTADIRAMVARLDDRRPMDVRDKALVLLGYAGAFRRSELVALDVEDVADTADGLVVTIRRSKTDQEAAGETVGIPYGSDPATCPVRAYRAHLAASHITSGPVFRGVRDGIRMSGKAAAARVQRLAELCGHDGERIGAHSLRAGLITQAVANGAHERDVMRHSRHRSVAVFRGYVRDVGLFDANPAAAAGL